jgi:hypothetical protein
MPCKPPALTIAACLLTTSCASTPPAPAAASTTPAAPATQACPATDSAPTDDGWQRTGYDQIARGPYRISKSHVARRHIGVSPVYHCFHRYAFLGACPCPDQAKALCLQHHADQHQGHNPDHDPHAPHEARHA